MEVRVTEDCIGCGLCVSLCPDVFYLNGQGTAESQSPVPAKSEAVVQEAADTCPAGAIKTK